MDLTALVQGFMAKKQGQLCRDLAEKYRVSSEEVAEVVTAFMEETYGPAVWLARSITCKENMVLLFIGRKDCAICQRSRPVLQSFLADHNDMELVEIDYSEPSGLLYHIIHNQEKGMLPMIAFICRGDIKMIFTGESLRSATYEKYYYDMRAECCQNIYVH